MPYVNQFGQLFNDNEGELEMVRAPQLMPRFAAKGRFFLTVDGQLYDSSTGEIIPYSSISKNTATFTTCIESDDGIWLLREDGTLLSYQPEGRYIRRSSTIIDRDVDMIGDDADNNLYYVKNNEIIAKNGGDISNSKSSYWILQQLNHH
jgi:hypothetical protein